MNRQKKRFNKYLKDEQFRKWSKYLTDLGDRFYKNPIVVGVGESRKLTVEDIERVQRELIDRFPRPVPVVRHFVPMLPLISMPERMGYQEFHRYYFQSPMVNVASEVQKLIFVEQANQELFKRRRQWFT